MNITQYNEKRDELSVLLQDVITCLDEVDGKYEKLDMSSLKKTKEDIAAIRKKVYEDIYKIVLVAKYQGGKSTSFNAITGGSCISPMGNGSIKCSAAPVLAKSVEDESNVGVTICMRNNAELYELLAAGGFDGVDLASNESIEEAKCEWREKFSVWQDNSELLKEDERDMFFVAGFILEFFNHSVVQEYLRKECFDIPCEDIDKFAKFPDKYLTRYSQFGPGSFSPEEAVYAFVKKIDARVQSQYMSKIGASFVDAPGLFANVYDTNVTRAELSDASAVWYLLGAKAPGAEELEAIRECSKLCQGRVFFSANISDNKVAKPKWIEDVLPPIEQAVKNTVADTKVQPYHALLALLYIQGEYFVANGRWSDKAVEEFLAKRCELLGVPNPAAWPLEKCWKKLVKVCINQLYPAGHDEFDDLENSLSKEGLAIIRRECNWDGTVEAIREFVVNSKSKSILITDTAMKAIELIAALKNLLKLREQEANKSFDETHAAYVEAERKLTAFMEDVENSIAENLPKRKDEQIAMNVFENVFSASVKEIAAKAAPDIADKTSALRYIGAQVAVLARSAWRFVRNMVSDVPDCTPIENSFKVEINQIMRNTVSEVLGGKMTHWLQQTNKGKNSRVNDVIITPGRTVFVGLQHKWQLDCANDQILNSLAPVTPPMPSALLLGNTYDIDLTSALGSISISELINDIVSSVLWGIIVYIIPEPITQCILVFIYIFRRLSREMSRRDEMIEKISEAIDDKISDCFNKERDVIISKMTPKLSVFREAVIEAIRKPFIVIAERFKQAKEEALSAYMRDSVYRKQVARESKEIRETYIEGEQGLEQRISNYIAETEPLCADESASNK